MSLNQFSVHQLKPEPQFRPLRNKSYQYVLDNHISVVASNYRQIYMDTMPEEMSNCDIRHMLEKDPPPKFQSYILKVSDVLVVTRAGISMAYYVDVDALIPLLGFFQFNSSTALITVDTTGFIIEGRKGSWMAADDMVIDGKQFFLMAAENQRRQAFFAVVDDQGRQVARDTDNGFDDATIRQIRESMKPLEPAVDHTRSPDGKIKLETWHKYHENGEYLRSVESGTEQNYNMIDGVSNNMKPQNGVPEIQLPMVPKKRQNTKPKEIKHIVETPEIKTSVLKRLRDAQSIVAARYGKKLPEQEKTEEERSRK